MVLIETDIILALASAGDKHHREAVEVVRSIKPLRLSPYALVELDLLILSGRIEVRIPEFYEGLANTLIYYGIEVVKPSPKHFEKAWKLRERYGLTYFDSLHASTAIVENEVLVSYDRIYSNVKELRCITPQEALRRYGSTTRS